MARKISKKRTRRNGMYSGLKEGAFTAWCKRHGFKDVQAGASHVLANPDRYSKKTVARARFAKIQKRIARRRKLKKSE